MATPSGYASTPTSSPPKCGYRNAGVDRLRWAALLHDIGKIRVPVKTLNKPAKLSTREWETIRQHPVAGAELASALLPWLGEWGRAIVEHHERFDGTGYPFGMSGRDISLAGRIVAVADSFEVMTASRVYKRAMTRSTALEELVRFSGSQFDPEVVRAFLAVSAPKLRWAMGPTSWLVGTPLLGSAPSLSAAGVAAQAAVGVSAVAVAGVTGLAGPAIAAAGDTRTRASHPRQALRHPRLRRRHKPHHPPSRLGSAKASTRSTPVALPAPLRQVALVSSPPGALPASGGAGQRHLSANPTPTTAAAAAPQPPSLCADDGAPDGAATYRNAGKALDATLAPPKPAKPSPSAPAPSKPGKSKKGPPSARLRPSQRLRPRCHLARRRKRTAESTNCQ